MAQENIKKLKIRFKKFMINTMYGTMFWRWWRSREIILEFYIWKTLLNARGSKLWIFSPIISVEKVGIQSSDGWRGSSATFYLSAFFLFLMSVEANVSQSFFSKYRHCVCCYNREWKISPPFFIMIPSQ